MILPYIKSYSLPEIGQNSQALYCAAFIVKLDYISGSKLVSIERQQEYYHELFRNHVDLLNCFTAREYGPYTIELRYIVEPRLEDFPNGKITPALIVRTSGDNEQTVVANSSKLFLDLWPLISSFSEEYNFIPLSDESEFESLLFPFNTSKELYCAEITRRAEYIPLSKIVTSNKPCGFIINKGGSDKKTLENDTYKVFYIYPFTPTLSDMSKLLERMLRQLDKCVLSISLKSLHNCEEEALHVEELLMACEKHLERIGLNQEVNVVPGSIIKGRASALSEQYQKFIINLLSHSFLLRTRILSESDISEGLIESVAIELLGKGGKIYGNVNNAFLGDYAVCQGKMPIDERIYAALEENFPEEPGIPKHLSRLKYITSPEETACLFRFPFPSRNVHHGITVKFSKSKSADSRIDKTGMFIGVNKYRSSSRPIFITNEDRKRHLYVIGQTGTGKTTLLESMILQDIGENGVCVLDPHGDLIKRVIPKIPKERMDDVIIFDPTDTERPIGLNLLHCKNSGDMYFVAQEILKILEALFPPEYMGPIFQHTIRNFLLTLMSNPDDPGTLVHIPPLYTNSDYHKRWLRHVTDPLVKSFWNNEWQKKSDFHKSEMCGYVISKFNGFISDIVMRNIIGQPKNNLDFREIMDKRKILLVNLCKGRLGEINSSLLGMLFVAKLQTAALSRADVPVQDRPTFFLYVDEFQNIATESFASILSEARKHGLVLCAANQFIHQLRKDIVSAIFGNVGSMVLFRVGIADAELLEQITYPDFNRLDLTNLPNFEAYVRLIVNNIQTRPFNINTVLDKTQSNSELEKAIYQLSRLRYGRDRYLVEQEINQSLNI